MERSRGIDAASGLDEIKDSFRREGLELDVVAHGDGWQAVGRMHGREWVMGHGPDAAKAAQAAWQRHLDSNAGTGES